MPTINATVFTAEAYVLVEASWSDMPQVTHAGVVRRNTVTGEEVFLRPYTSFDGNGNLLLSCGQGLWWDTEPPLNVPLEYCTFAADVPTLLTTNPDFEVTIAPWVSIGATSLLRSSAFSHEGTWSAELTPNGVSNVTTMLNTDNAVFTPNLPLTMSAWAMSPQGWNAVRLLMSINYDDGETQNISGPVEILDDGVWQYITFDFTPTKPGFITFIQIGPLGVAPATTLFYVDQIGVYQDQPVTATACDTVTVTGPDSFWLKNPLHPCLDVAVGICNPAMGLDCEEDSRVSYVGMGDDTRNPNTVLSEPANRIHPIPVSRQRRAPVSELRLLAHDCDALDSIIDINQPGDPLLFQAPADYCLPDRYISVGPLTETRISVDQREDFRLMSMPYAVTQRPEGPADGVCGARYSDLCDIYTSWQSLTLATLAWVDLLLGEASNDGPGSDPEALRTWDEVEAEFADWDAVEAGGTRDWDELRDGL